MGWGVSVKGVSFQTCSWTCKVARHEEVFKRADGGHLGFKYYFTKPLHFNPLEAARQAVFSACFSGGAKERGSYLEIEEEPHRT